MKEWMGNKIGQTATKQLTHGTCLQCGQGDLEKGVIIESINKARANSRFPPLHLVRSNTIFITSFLMYEFFLGVLLL